MAKNKRKEAYDKCVADYIKAFERKQGVKMDFPHGNHFTFGGKFIEFSAIRFDIDTKQKKGDIFEHYDYLIEQQSKGAYRENYAVWLNNKYKKEEVQEPERTGHMHIVKDEVAEEVNE